MSTVTTARPAARPAAGRPASRRRLITVAGGLVLPVALLAAWQAAASTGVYSVAQLPPPLSVAQALGELVDGGLLWQHIAISVQRVLIGFAAGSALGFALGALVGLSATVRTLLAPSIAALRAVPSLAWVPLLVLWLGIGEGPKITLVAIGSFFPVYTTLSAALAHTDPHLVELGRAYGLRGASLLGRIMLPGVAPSIFSGLRLGLAQGWLFLVAAELIASSMGLGFLLTDSQNTGRTDILLLAILLLAALGKTCDVLLGLVERRVLRTHS
ncbi:ABC transporter permease [Microtetraspora sp. NBRC 13810]|uniref:ABC transporter permease n=1 Tax=Microtetraspora sp. NBRC 13810 TaxID=3030990 RepID=UPI0024A0010F|nr:ABC transporter permease [Microtetraspora sp. NBRC 13810]GLW05935.1 ABC transporter permease [Microtetraspora sp. NBRC 13810]